MTGRRLDAARRAARWTMAVGLVLLLALVAACEGNGQDAGGDTQGGAPEATTTQATTRSADEQQATPTRPRAPKPAEAVILTGAVSSVVDGDTIKVVSRGFETTVRLIGIDTPETRHPSKPVQCFGPAASDRTRRLLPEGQRVRLVGDPTQDRRDRYDRLLAYVFRPGPSGARGSVNYALVATGYAKVYIYGGVPFQHAAAFQTAEAAAESQGKGLWGPPCNGDTTKRDPSVAPPTQEPAPAPAPAPSPGPEPAPGNCDPNYEGACIPPYPPDLDCADVPAVGFSSVGSDPHGFDGDGDGVACESF